MNKKEFVAFLNQRLAVLDEKERKEIIDEYVQHIEIKVENGKTEEEAIKDFGDLNEFVEEILSAYHVNPKSNMDKNFIYDILDNLAKFINQMANSILKLDSSQIVRLILEFILLLIIIALIKLPISFLLSLVFDIVFFLPWGITSVLHGLLRFIFEICYFLIACFVIYTFFKDRVYTEKNQERENASKNDSIKKESKKTEKKTVALQEDVHIIDIEDSDIVSKSTIVDLKEPEIKTYKKPEEIRQRNQEREKTSNYSGSFEKVVIAIIKFFLIFVLVPMIFLLIIQMIGFGFILGLLLKGVSIIGVFLIICGTLIITISIVSGLSSFIFKGGK